jgi:hypothetical protein
MEKATQKDQHILDFFDSSKQNDWSMLKQVFKIFIIVRPQAAFHPDGGG